jgi:hypothetical protein
MYKRGGRGASGFFGQSEIFLTAALGDFLDRKNPPKYQKLQQIF